MTAILLASALLPILMVKNHVFGWDDGLEELRRVYPNRSYIDVGGKTQWGTSGNFKWREYLIIPGLELVRVSKVENQGITVHVKSTKGLYWVGASILGVLGLFLFVALPYIRKNGIFPP